MGQCSPEILTPKQQLALFMAARDHKNRTPLAPLSSYIFFTKLDFLSRKVKRICQARFSVSARVAITGLALRDLHSLGDGHQPAQPSVCGCENAAPPPLFSRARFIFILDFFFFCVVGVRHYSQEGFFIESKADLVEIF